MLLQFPLLVFILLAICQAGFGFSKRGEPSGDVYSRYMKMPGVTPKVKDEYICSGKALNTSAEEWVVSFDPLASANRAHHMLLYGCSSLNQNHLDGQYWDCGHHGVCAGGSTIIYAWAKNAPGIHLPPDVGFRIGGNTDIKFLVLQIHYANPLPEGTKDTSGVKMVVTQEPQKYKAGIFLLLSAVFQIPPLTEKAHANSNCRLGNLMPQPINIFGFRVHAHSLGSVITGFKYNPETFELREIVRGNPQWPQAFYPLNSVEKIELQEVLHVRCTYNSSTRDRITYSGATSDDEMCNLYLMYYTDAQKGSSGAVCSFEMYKNLTEVLPTINDVPLPPNQQLESMAKGKNVNKDKEISYQTTFNQSATSNDPLSHFDAQKALAGGWYSFRDASHDPSTYDMRYRRRARLSLSSPYTYNNYFESAYGPKSIEDSRTVYSYQKIIQMPGVSPTKSDAYMCTFMELNSTQEEWVLLYNPLASANRAHHMLLYGCSGVSAEFRTLGAWDCIHHGVCEGGRIMYAWAKNAPSTHLPKDVGFRVGGSSGINYLVLQIHYATPLPNIKDNSGLQLTLTTTPQKYKAGIFLLAAGSVDIPPFTEKTHADINCLVAETEPVEMNLFAFRVHAHKLGSVISGYLFDREANSLKEIAKGNPQWPQAFYPTDHVIKMKPNNILHARCTYNSSTSAKHTYIGSTSADEMCNLYLMYYTDAEKGSESGHCWMEEYPLVTKALPPSSDEPLPPNPLLEELTHGENKNKDKEVSYNSLFKTKEPIELEKKTQSRKDPQPSSFNEYEYPNYDGYDYRQPALNPPLRDWSTKVPQDYYNFGARLKATPDKSDEKYQLKPKPVHTYEEYEGNSDATGPVEYYGNGSGQEKSMDQSKKTIVSASKQGKQLNSVTGFHVVDDWGPLNYKLGQVTAVAVDSRGDVVIFHRGDRIWDGSSFHENVFTDKENPIAQGTLLHLQRADGGVMHEWGANFFFMPHGLTLDKDDNIWLTDVAMHQVFKFPSGFGQGKPILTLGKKFEPGSDDDSFCKPTGVAVMKNGEFFVSDGYCNTRIVHFSASGKVIKQFGASSWTFVGLGFNVKDPADGVLSVPHAITLAEDSNEVCVADRENGRVQCFKIDTGKYQRQFKFDEWGRVFSVAYTPHLGRRLFVVNGPQLMGQHKVEVYEVSFSEGKLLSSFSPHNQGLSNPHDIVLSKNGTELYVVEIGPNKIWKFLSDSAPKSRVTSSAKNPKVEVKMGQLQEDAHNTLSLFSGGYSSLGISSVVLGLVAVPIVVLSTLAIIMKCRGIGTRTHYLDNNKFINNLNGKHKNGTLNLGSLLNKRHGFEKVATNDIDDDDLDSADSDVEEFSLSATKV